MEKFYFSGKVCVISFVDDDLDEVNELILGQAGGWIFTRDDEGDEFGYPIEQIRYLQVLPYADPATFVMSIEKRDESR